MLDSLSIRQTVLVSKYREGAGHVGPNQHGLPDAKAIEIYTKFSTGSNKGNKVYTTQDKHNMMITLKDDGGWSLDVNQ